MNYARITQVAHYAPEQIVTNDDLAKMMDTSDEWISSRTGIKQRHLSRTESTSDLATKVAEQLLEKAQLSADQLDFIIVATITPDSMMPSTAARVQANIGATKATPNCLFYYDINQFIRHANDFYDFFAGDFGFDFLICQSDFLQFLTAQVFGYN